MPLDFLSTLSSYLPDPVHWVAPYLKLSVTIYSVSAALILWALVSGIRLRWHTRKLCKAIFNADKLIRSAPDAITFASQFESLSDKIGKINFIGQIWQNFYTQLIIPDHADHAGQSIGSGTRPENWFDTHDLLRSAKVNTRFEAALPNLLVGAGLAFTFLGIAAALSLAGNIAAPDVTSDGRNQALHELLSAASFKFLTSLVGLVLSIVYALYRKKRLKAVEKAVDRFNADLAERIPLRTQAWLQNEANRLLQRQFAVLESFSHDLAVNIGTAFDTAFDQRLGEHIGPLAEAMQKLSEGVGSQTKDTMDQMSGAFLEKLSGVSGDTVGRMNDTLAGLGNQLEIVQAGLGDAAARMSAAADAMATRMGEGAEASAARLTRQIEAMVEELRHLAADSQQRGATAFEALALRIAAAAEGFEASASRVAATLGRASEMTGAALGRGAEDAVARIASATEGMRAEFQAFGENLRVAMESAGGSIRDNASQGGAALRDAVAQAGEGMAAQLSATAQALDDAGKQAGAALRTGGKDAADHISVAGGSLAGRADNLGKQIDQLQTGAAALQAALQAQDRASRDAATALAASATDLRAGAGASRAAAEPLSKLADTIRGTAELFSGTASRMTEANQQTASLANSLNDASTRFRGVDQDIAKTLAALQTGLQGFASQIQKITEETDKNLARAATQLGQVTQELRDSLEDFTEAQPRRQSR